MAAVSQYLMQAIIDLQGLPSLQNAVLGGGTSLALRFEHRQSIDIDLFFSGLIGKEKFGQIEREVKESFGERLFGLTYPCYESDQYIFIRFFLRVDEGAIKIEILQNANFIDNYEVLNGIKLASIGDIAMMKLMTVANRASQKDVYDLDYITDHVPLPVLMDALRNKQDRFNREEHKTIFDMDGEVSPVDDPQLLLKFEEVAQVHQSRPKHGDNRVLPLQGSKNWIAARSSYRRKIRDYFRQNDIPFPPISSIH